MRWTFALVLALLVASLPATAGEIRYKVNGEERELDLNDPLPDTPPYSDITIPLSDADLEFGATVHLYSVGGSLASVGQITFTGRVLSNFAVVSVVVADESLQDVGSAFFDSFEEQLPGLRHCGGVRFVHADPMSTDTSFRDHVRLSLTIRGDLTGDVTAGNLFRVDALRYFDLLPGNRFGGTISGNLRATRGDSQLFGFLGASRPAIGNVRARVQISGNITADGERDASGDPLFTIDHAFDADADADPDPGNYVDAYPNARWGYRETWGSIGRIVVGPDDEIDPPLGLLGNIDASNGVIGEIFCAGQIGTSETSRSQIKAGVQVGRISTRDGATGSLLIRTMNADVDATQKLVSPEEAGYPATMTLIETDGDYNGDIKLLDVFCQSNDMQERQRSNGRKGIYIGGRMNGNIDVKYSYEYADIIARSFTGTITIGQTLRGAVVAVGTPGGAPSPDGVIHSISVGYGGDFAAAPRPNNIPGLTGMKTSLIAPPFEGVDRDVWYIAPSPAQHGGSIDGLVRAANLIESGEFIAIYSRFEDSPGAYPFRARVESPSFGSLLVGDFDCGTIWSGTLEPSAGRDDGTIEDDYAAFGSISIGCMGPKSDLWVEDTQLVSIENDLRGEVHFPSIASAHTLRVGGSMGDREQAEQQVALCYAEYDALFAGVSWQSIDGAEQSPRGVWSSIENHDLSTTPGVANYGRILIREPNGLHGQIIIDANNTGSQRAGTHWLGDVEIGTGESPDIGDPNISVTPEVISTNATRATPFDTGTGTGEGPLYTALPSDFGGGAVGLVPFTVHDRATWPPNPGAGEQPPQVLLEPVINDPDEPIPGERRTVDLEFYGPVRATGTAHPVLIYKAPLSDPTAFVPQPVNEMFEIAVRRTGMGGDSSRMLVISRSPGQMIPKGVYKVVPIRDTSAASFLYCDGLESLTPVADFVYLFAIGGDCQPNGTADAYDIANGTSEDLNGDTIPDECDPPVSGTCAWHYETGATPSCEAGDYDNNGGVDGSDLAAFFVDFEAGETCADVDQNGGVDGADIGAFFAFFEAGGC